MNAGDGSSHRRSVPPLERDKWNAWNKRGMQIVCIPLIINNSKVFINFVKDFTISIGIYYQVNSSSTLGSLLGTFPMGMPEKCSR